MTDAEFCTLQEAADELGVHYMTAYRYVRQGMLPAERIGRVWQVARADIDTFRDQRDRSAEPGQVVSREQVDWADRLERRLVAGDRTGAIGVLESALAAGTEPAALQVDVVAPAMRSIGDRWETGELDVAVEHRATVIVTQILAVLASRFARRGVSRGVVLLGAVAGERHALPVRLVADVVRLAGFEVMDLGDDVPVESFATLADDVDRLVAVGVSVTMRDHLDDVRATIVALRRVVDVPIFVGGGAVTSIAEAEALGADRWAADARAVVAVLEGLSANG